MNDEERTNKQIRDNKKKGNINQHQKKADQKDASSPPFLVEESSSLPGGQHLFIYLVASSACVLLLFLLFLSFLSFYFFRLSCLASPRLSLAVIIVVVVFPLSCECVCARVCENEVEGEITTLPKRPLSPLLLLLHSSPPLLFSTSTYCERERKGKDGGETTYFKRGKGNLRLD
jgi:hypothetical protein